ncbi:MAG: phosphomannomutase/phosphoglucomutase [Deltaproteobacteria bacterium]|nr:phosphomannomutase/phosphoglucomutase [Deltaproteobacteria bacterium]
MRPYIFREYDIRGRCPDELGEETAFLLGRTFGTYFRERGARSVSLGRDCRLSSPMLAEALRDGLLITGTSVVDLGIIPTPLLYFSLHHLKVDGGVQITGSHNPPEYNGFKICLGKATLYGEEIQKLLHIAESGVFFEGRGELERKEILEPYMEQVSASVHVGPIPRKVVIDAGNGVGGLVAPELYRRMGVRVEELFCEPDGRFPNHHPDPTILENLDGLSKKVASTDADLGIAFDGDADRIGVMERDGKIIWGDQLMILFSRHILKKNPGAKIIGEVKCSQTLYDDIEKHGGRPIMWKAGHSLIKGKMKEEGALLAGEMSGHIFFADRYYGFDDAIYAGARLLEILTSEQRSIRDHLADVPVFVSTSEIRIDCEEEKKFLVVSRLVETFKKDFQVIDVDGARVLFEGGWGLVRASNTQPVLVLRFEAVDEKRLHEIRDFFMDKLAKEL